MNATATEVQRRVTIHPDEGIDSPRDWDNLGTMVCWHSRYDLGDEQETGDSSEWLRNLAGETVNVDDPDLIPDEHVQRIIEKYFIMLSLYLYDHSGITMNTTGFSCPWDSGQVGWIYCTKEKGRESLATYTDEAVREVLVGEVEIYDQYLRGDVYYFLCEEGTVCDKGEVHWEVTNSCCGFYGSDVEENGMLDGMPDEFHELAKEAEVTYP